MYMDATAAPAYAPAPAHTDEHQALLPGPRGANKTQASGRWPPLAWLGVACAGGAALLLGALLLTLCWAASEKDSSDEVQRAELSLRLHHKYADWQARAGAL